MSTPESVKLTIPGGRRHVGIARLFVGGLAARVGLGFEAMRDLQLAVESVLITSRAPAEVTVEACFEADSVSILIGPFDQNPLGSGASQAGQLGLERLLAALVDHSESYERDDGYWVSLDARTAAVVVKGHT